LKFLISKIGWTTGDPGRFCNFRYFAQELYGGNSATDDDDVFPNEGFGMAILAGMQLLALKLFPAGVLRTMWGFPSAGRINEPTGAELNAIGANDESSVSLRHLGDPDRADDGKVKCFFVLFVVFRNGDIGL